MRCLVLMRVVLLLMLTTPALAKDIAVPSGLEADVVFWERIFGKYTPNHCVFHDRDDLGTIYGVAKLPAGSPSQQARFASRYLGVLRNALEYLADGGEPRNKLERIITSSTPKERREPAYYREAAANVRCQRGVDLQSSIERSRAHLKMVKRVLRQKRLPQDLAYLPHLESGYHVRAQSHVGARGLWQFMPATARLQGLRVSRSQDARTDPYLATVAAANYLRELHDRTGSWPLAITAYNYGPNGMVRAIKQWGTDYMTIRQNHKTKIFGFAARNYYPSFLAVRNVAARAERGEDMAAN